MKNGAWVKLGQIIDGASIPNLGFETTHATLPVICHGEHFVSELYFSVRDDLGRSHSVKMPWTPSDPLKTDLSSASLILSPGKLGLFDDSGAMVCNALTNGGTKFLYYIGWNLGQTVPFRNSVGLAVEDSGTTTKMFEGPILDRTKNEPQFCASCEVLVDDHGLWRMWYLNCTEWLSDSRNQAQHRYHLKYAESRDGINWERNGIVAIDYASDEEVAISRPSVIRDGDDWHMWFSCRDVDSSYKINYAFSRDGITWKRENSRFGLFPSETGWDSQMVEYPCVFKHQGHLYMLYNGNGFGQSGIGLARWETH